MAICIECKHIDYPFWRRVDAFLGGPESPNWKCAHHSLLNPIDGTPIAYCDIKNNGGKCTDFEPKKVQP